MSEYHDQKALFEYAAIMANQDPAWSMLVAIPNGQYRPGQRKEAGLKNGFPDIGLFVARDGFFGMFIELKFGKNKATEQQGEWLIDLVEEGYFAVVATGFEEAKKYIEWYLAQEQT